MKLVFDPDFDQGYWPGPLRDRAASAGEDWVGPFKLVRVLETAFGVGGPTLTSRQRAARLVPAMRSCDGFWSASAGVDPFSTARHLLAWRDTLSMAGWRGDGGQPRLAALAKVTVDAGPGLADRLRSIQEVLGRRAPDVETIECLTPRGDLEPLWRQTFDLLEQRGVRIVETALSPVSTARDTDLAAARAARFKPRGDGSLRLLRPVGPLAAAEEVAAWIARIASLPSPPEVLLVGQDPALDAALHRHGLPTTGAAHAYGDSASLQILPLALDLGWSPQDPQRAYELLSLDSSPIPAGVRWRLREALGHWPAVDSDAWRDALAAGLAAIEDADRRGRVADRLETLWSARVSRSGPYPAAELLTRVGLLRNWLTSRLATADDGGDTWRAAIAQCDSLLDLVNRSGLTELSAAQLRHLVIEATASASDNTPYPPEARLPRVGSPGAVVGPVGVVVWWGFDTTAAPGISRLPLTRDERTELQGLGVQLPDTGAVAAAQARRWRRPLDQATDRVLLVCPEKGIDGGDLYPHPLWDDLVSRVDEKNTRLFAEQKLLRTSLSEEVPQTPRTLLQVPAPRPEWTVAAGQVKKRERESPSSVQALFGCPLHWALHYAAKLDPPDGAQVADGTSPRLLGELLHAVMNRLFEGPAQSAADAAKEASAILDREGPRMAAALFLPGADAQRERVRRVAMNTARALYTLMADAKLTVLATEQERDGRALDTTLAGRVDLVLGPPPHILDLKWGGAPGKRRLLEAGAALQLAAYAFLERKDRGPFPPVGYFIMDSQRLLTTQPEAFVNAEGVPGPSPEETWRVVEATHKVEWDLVASGRLSARGVTTEDGEKPLKEPCVEDGRLRLLPPCGWCDYSALCGRAFGEDA